MKVLTIVCLSFVIVLSPPKANADPVSGKYKVTVVVPEYGAGALGNLTIDEYNEFYGSVRGGGYKIFLEGYVDRRRNLIFSPRPDGFISISANILKRNGMVVGMRGNVEDEWGDRAKIVGYKARDLR